MLFLEVSAEEGRVIVHTEMRRLWIRDEVVVVAVPTSAVSH